MYNTYIFQSSSPSYHNQEITEIRQQYYRISIYVTGNTAYMNYLNNFNYDKPTAIDFKNAGSGAIQSHFSTFLLQFLSTKNINVVEIVIGMFNNVGLYFSKQIQQALTVNNELKTLKITDQINFGPTCAKNLSEGLKLNKGLTSLDLSSSYIERIIYHIGDAGIIHIANALKTNQTLKILNVSGQLITDKSVDTIIEMLQLNKSLTELNLLNNKFIEGAKQILLQLNTYGALTTLHIDSVINDEIYQSLNKALKNKNKFCLNIPNVEDKYKKDNVEIALNNYNNKYETYIKNIRERNLLEYAFSDGKEQSITEIKDGKKVE